MRSKTSDKLSVNIDHVYCTLKFQRLFVPTNYTVYIIALKCIIRYYLRLHSDRRFGGKLIFFYA